MPKFICEGCGLELTEDEALFCPECGSKLRQVEETPVAAAAPVASAPATPNVYCTSCGAQIPDPNMRFCPGCGASRDGGPVPAPAPAPALAPSPVVSPVVAAYPPVSTSPGMGGFRIIIDKRATYMEGTKSRGGGNLRLSTYELHYLSSRYNFHIPLTDITYVTMGSKNNIFELGTTSGAVHTFKLFKAEVYVQEIQRMITAVQQAAPPQPGGPSYGVSAPVPSPAVQAPMPSYGGPPAPAPVAGTGERVDIEGPGGYKGEDQWYNGKLSLSNLAFKFDGKKKELEFSLEEIEKADSTDKGNMFLLVLKDGAEHKFRVFKAGSWIEEINAALQN
ncbi:MAG: zinc-ribbon domain-containing protein [Candidatus Hodarchaeota archaeon]